MIHRNNPKHEIFRFDIQSEMATETEFKTLVIPVTRTATINLCRSHKPEQRFLKNEIPSRSTAAFEDPEFQFVQVFVAGIQVRSRHSIITIILGLSVKGITHPRTSDA